jgi:hypothetical protein
MRGTNDGGHVIPTVVGTVEDEMAALERLGPLTRRAIYEAPVRYAALGIIGQIEAEQERQRALYPEHVRGRIVIDPKRPDLDRSLARGIAIESRKTIMRDRSEADALLGVKPIVPRRGAAADLKVLRSERAAERRMRRLCR